MNTVELKLMTYLVHLYVESRWLMAHPPYLPHQSALDAAVPVAQSGLATILVGYFDLGVAFQGDI